MCDCQDEQIIACAESVGSGSPQPKNCSEGMMKGKCIVPMKMNHPNASTFLCALDVNEDDYCDWGHYQPDYIKESRK